MNKSTKSGNTNWGKTYDTTKGKFENLDKYFWDPPASTTVKGLKLRKGMKVLDIGCGSGSTVILESKQVGPKGEIIGVDLSEKLLSVARSRIKENILTNIKLMKKDMSKLNFFHNSFDAVVSELSIFFVPNIQNQIKKLWRLVKPGGKMAITTWGKNPLSPMYEKWYRILNSIDTKLSKYDRPWELDYMSDPYLLRNYLIKAGIPNLNLTVTLVIESFKITSADDVVTCVMGTGMRAGLPLMSAKQKKLAFDKLSEWTQKNKIHSLIRNPIIAIAQKPYV